MINTTIYKYMLNQLNPLLQEKKRILEGAFRSLYNREYEFSKTSIPSFEELPITWTPFYNSTGRAGFLVHIKNANRTLISHTVKETFDNIADILSDTYNSFSHVLYVSEDYTTTLPRDYELTTEDKNNFYFMYVYPIDWDGRIFDNFVCETIGRDEMIYTPYAIDCTVRIEFLLAQQLNLPDQIDLFLQYQCYSIQDILSYLNINLSVDNEHFRSNYAGFLELDMKNPLPPFQYDILFLPTDELDIHYYFYIKQNIERRLLYLNNRFEGMLSEVFNVSDFNHSDITKFVSYSAGIELRNKDSKSSYGYMNKMLDIHVDESVEESLVCLLKDFNRYDSSFMQRLILACDSVSPRNHIILYYNEYPICYIQKVDILDALAKYNKDVHPFT